jgi:asparagine synthase (glutamine-hydrolysing)
MSYFSRQDLNDLYTDEFATLVSDRPSADRLIRDAWDSSSARGPIQRLLDVDLHTYLPGDLLVKTDIASMAHSLEVRSPLLDHVLIERVAELPEAYKLRRGETKALLKEAMRPWLPEEVLSRPKMGFGVPLADWFRGRLAQLPREVLLDRTALGRRIFRPDRIGKLIDDHVSRTADHANKLWSLIQLELWFRTYVDVGVPDARPPAVLSTSLR